MGSSHRLEVSFFAPGIVWSRLCFERVWPTESIEQCIEPHRGHIMDRMQKKKIQNLHIYIPLIPL